MMHFSSSNSTKFVFGLGSAPDLVRDLTQCPYAWLGRETPTLSFQHRATHWGPGIVKCVGPTIYGQVVEGLG